MADLKGIFGGAWTPPVEKVFEAPEGQLRAAMVKCGIEPPGQIFIDGKIHRFCSGTKGASRTNDKSGWYVAFGDGVPSGRFGCWRLGLDSTWRAEVVGARSVSDEMSYLKRMEEAKILRDAAIEKQQHIASLAVEAIWAQASLANGDHPYLKRKAIQPHGARVTGDGRLIVPLFDRSGHLSSLQYIAHDGVKLYHPGGEARGKFWMLGSLDEPGALYVAEGFATSATVYETTGRPCVVCYSASSIVPVVATLREMYGEGQSIVIVADHDHHGIGQNYADQASAKYGARVVMPPIKGMDANDYVMAGHDLKAILIQQSGIGVIEKLKMVFGDQLSADYEAPNELVEGLLTIGGLTVVYGTSNSGKTFWALSVATAIAMGTDCYGRKTDQGLVVYLASESPSSIRSRVQAIKKFYDCSLENFAMVPVPVNFYANGQDAIDVIELVKTVEKLRGKPVRLIICDTLSRISAGANENSGEDMGPVMARFEQLAAVTKAAVMIIHHNGKDVAKGARGWSGIRAHIDTEIEVSEKDGVRSVSVTKQRELPSKGDLIYFKLEVVEMGFTKFGKVATTCVAVNDEQHAEANEPKKMSKHQENIKIIERAWKESGLEEKNGFPYVTRSALRNLLINDGMSERTAKNKTEPSRQDGIIFPLINAEIIKPFEHGWVVVNGPQVSAFLLQKRC